MYYTYHQQLMKSLGGHGCSSLLLIHDEAHDGLTLCEQLVKGYDLHTHCCVPFQINVVDNSPQ
jgi:hypothetical protein